MKPISLFGGSNALEKRVKALEDALIDLSTEISILKTTFAKLNARITTQKREESKTPTAEQVLEDLVGGKVLNIEETK